MEGKMLHPRGGYGLQSDLKRDMMVSDITLMRGMREEMTEEKESEIFQTRRHREMRTQRLSRHYIGEIPISPSPWSDNNETILDSSFNAKEKKEDKEKMQGESDEEDSSGDEKESKSDKTSSSKDQKYSKEEK
jgi:hypothetical protein